MRSWTTSGLPVARCKVTKKSSGMHDSGRALGQRDISSLFLSFAHHLLTLFHQSGHAFARLCPNLRAKEAGDSRIYDRQKPGRKPTELFLGSASILRLESSAASVNFSRGQPQFQEGANRGSTARHSSHESPVINLPQLLWREHNLEPLSARH